MVSFRAFITEEVDILSAHAECAEARVPLPDSELPNLRKTHNGWEYDTEHGKISHCTTSHGMREKGAGYITHYNGKTIHRDDGPAVIHSDGSQIWFNRGTRTGSYTPVTKNNPKEQHWDGGQPTTHEAFARKFKGYSPKS